MAGSEKAGTQSWELVFGFCPGKGTVSWLIRACPESNNYDLDQ